MQWLVSLFGGHPFRIALVAAVLLAAGFARAGGTGGRPARAVMVAAALWFLYAGWEWLVLVRTPDAGIRVDLLVIWHVPPAASLWAIYRLLRSSRSRPS